MTQDFSKAKVAVVMGSKSDWDTIKESCEILEGLNIPFLSKVVSAHRTPDFMFEFAEKASENGIEVIIAGAGGAAHLPGMIASKTHLPVLGVPVQSKALNGMDSLLSIVQMPAGIPVGTLAIGKSGAKNAALLAASILSLNDETIKKALINWRNKQTKKVLEDNS
ncbi:MAG: 5-(carboxyamino)imidazole ribonucleotide mutase [Candidatus Caenarcaniphilales bacterium]|nr:5-(carboxyamino)imidazole ribonucleotide mutase [Candidatus Caenarcaniphilales bacterium]